METSLEVRLHALVVVESEDWENFKVQLHEVKKIVRTEGNDVITHECYKRPNTDQILIIEAYASEKAFLNHLKLIQNIAEHYPAKLTFQWIELIGAYSIETIQFLKDARQDCEVTYLETI